MSNGVLLVRQKDNQWIIFNVLSLRNTHVTQSHIGTRLQSQ